MNYDPKGRQISCMDPASFRTCENCDWVARVVVDGNYDLQEKQADDLLAEHTKLHFVKQARPAHELGVNWNC